MREAGSALDADEIQKFERIGEDWWNEDGSMRALHRLNPLRIAFIRDMAVRHLHRNGPIQAMRPLAGLSLLDIGCGGGLLSEPMARLGASVTGIDPAPRNIAVAEAHAARQELAVAYRAATVETLLGEGARFDVVLMMEVVEHVAEPDAFLKAACGLVRPGGLLVASTLNRTLKSFALAIVGAEYILRWLPRGTHAWDRFVTVGELTGGVRVVERTGIVFDPLRQAWRLGRDMDVNYMIVGQRRV